MFPLPHSDPADDDPQFVPDVLDASTISVPLLAILRAEQEGRSGPPRAHRVIIDLNLEYRDGRKEGRARALALVRQAVAEASTVDGEQGVNELKSELSDQYLFARLDGEALRHLVRLDRSGDVDSLAAPAERAARRTIHRIWPDFPVKALITTSISTVKADAARIAFSASGERIVWAVLDSGIDGDHPHFRTHDNLSLDPSLAHRDFTVDGGKEAPLDDGFGHGTHVAGIIAGAGAAGPQPLRASTRYRDELGNVTSVVQDLPAISGMAPKCKLLSLKVLDDQGQGVASNLIAALEHVQRLNGYGRRLRIHGVNLSVGYEFEPEWFACGQSPLCVEVDRLVRSGVVVVAAAGNTGYGWQSTKFKGTVTAGMDLTINDPGNADLAITVGSTHRESPHVYGVSYFSSKGPTGDGRLKPDLVAPGEKILSCAAGQRRAAIPDPGVDYVEDSGTSMAAPHVSGVIASFLSVRREFLGRPEQVKDIFTSTATDLRRERTFQGHGLVDLMRAIQSI